MCCDPEVLRSWPFRTAASSRSWCQKRKSETRSLREVSIWSVGDPDDRVEVAANYFHFANSCLELLLLQA